MLSLLLLIGLVFAGLYYGETHGIINPGGVIPDLRNIHLPKLGGGGSDHFDYWKRG